MTDNLRSLGSLEQFTPEEFSRFQQGRCIVCEIPYSVASNSDRKFCSNACRKVRFREWTKAWDVRKASRAATCIECNEPFKASPTGPLPQRCPSCKRAINAARARERYRAAKP